MEEEALHPIQESHSTPRAEDLQEYLESIRKDIDNRIRQRLENQIVATRLNGSTVISYVGTKVSETPETIYLEGFYKGATRKIALHKEHYQFEKAGSDAYQIYSAHPNEYEQVLHSSRLKPGNEVKITLYIGSAVKTVSGMVENVSSSGEVTLTGGQYPETIHTHQSHAEVYIYALKNSNF